MKLKQLASGVLAAVMAFTALSATAAALPARAAAPAAPADGLALYSSFDDGSAKDLSGNGNDGVLIGDLGVVDGVSSRALHISGQNVAQSDSQPGDRYVDYGRGIDFSTTDFSISLWYQSLGASKNCTLLSNKDFSTGKNTGFAMGCFDNGLRFNLTPEGNDRADLENASGALGGAKDGGWHHLGVTVDRDGKMAYYVDGALAAEKDVSASAGDTLDAGLPLILGAGGNRCNAADNCNLDELRIYTRALSADEVNSLYELDKPPVDLTDGLELYVSFDDGSAADLSGNGNNGDVAGSPAFTEGVLGQAIVLDNGDAAGSETTQAVQYVDFGLGFDELLGSGDFTLSFWMKTEGHGANNGALIANKDYLSGSNVGMAVGNFNNASNIDIRVNYSASKGSRVENKGIQANDDSWHQVLTTFDRDGDMVTYLDGAEVKRASMRSHSGKDGSTGLPLRLGSDGKGIYGMSGVAVDELRLYGKVLSAAEIDALYAQESVFTGMERLFAQLEAIVPSAAFPQEKLDAMAERLDDWRQQIAAQPEQAADLLAQAEAAFEVFLDGETPKASFHLVSDVHINGESERVSNYAAAMQDMASLMPDTNIAFVNAGDFTSQSSAAQYESFFETTAQYNPVSDEQTLILLGNHDVRGSNTGGNWVKDPNQEQPYWSTARGLYLEHNARYMPDDAVENDTLYFAKELGGYTFIMLNTEKGLKDAMYMSEEQLAWFEQTMRECYEEDPTKPVFIISHQPLNNTHWMSNILDGFDGWNNAEGTGPYGQPQSYNTGMDAAVKEVMAKYPVGVFLSGHIHNQLDVAELQLREYGVLLDLPSFAEPCIGMTDIGTGYEVAIYDDEIVFRARNFVTGSWMPEYDKVVRLPLVSGLYQQARAAEQTGGYTADSLAAVTRAADALQPLMTRCYDQEGLAWNNTATPPEFYFHADTLTEMDSLRADLQQALAGLEQDPDAPPVDPTDKEEDPKFTALREKWTAYLLGGTGSDLDLTNDAVKAYVKTLNENANGYWQTMAKSSDAGRTNLWSDLDMTPIQDYSQAAYTRSGNMATTMTRLRDIAYAWATEGCDIYHSDEVLAELISALDHMTGKYFVCGQHGYGNWYHWEITAPTALMNACMVLYDELTQAQLDRYTQAAAWYVPYCDKGGPNSNGPKMTGGNLLLKANGVAQCGILMQDASMLENVKAGVKTVLVYNDPDQFYTKDADGFYADGSYIQHQALAYIGGYGADLYQNLGVFLNVLSGSDWAIAYDDHAESVAYDFIFNGVEPFIYEGHTMDMVSSRDVTRSNHDDHERTGRLLEALLPLRGSFPTEEQNQRFDSLMKYVLEQDSAFYFAQMDSIYAIMTGVQILADDSVAPRGEYTLTKTFTMDKTVHLTRDFGFALSMHSDRTYGHELINQEGKRTWNTSDGMYYLYTGDVDQYSGGFWATVDPTRLPGTTAEHVVFSDGAGDRTKNLYAWTGGASLDGYGAAGTHMRTLGSKNSSTRNGADVKKSWFMFDDRILALGSGITSSTGNTVETIIENRKIRTDLSNTVTVDGQPADLSSAVTLTPTWMHLQGNVAGSDIGYWFPEEQQVTAFKEVRTGDWSAQGVSTGEATNGYATFLFDHGENPAGASYEYMLLPGKTAAETAAYAAAPDVTVLSNTDSIHAARDERDNVTAANFWDETGGAIAGIAVDQPASVVMRRQGDTVRLSVSDPTQSDALIGLTLAMGGSVTEASDNITVVQSGSFVQVSVDTTGLGGQCSYLTVQLDPAASLEVACVLTGLEPLQVALGTSFKYLNLPDTVTVLANDGQEYEAGVEWDRSGYDRLNIGSYTLTGKLILPEGLGNSAGITARIEVTVGSASQPVSADTYVVGGSHADEKGVYANAASLNVKLDTDPSYVRKALFRIDLSELPSSFETVWFQMTVTADEQGFTLGEVYQIGNDWDPASVSYNTVPARVSGKAAASFTLADAQAGPVKLDVTEAVRRALEAGESEISFEVVCAGTAGSKNQLSIESMEAASEADRPFLTWDCLPLVEYVDKANLQLLVDTAAELDADGFANYDADTMADALAQARAVLDDPQADAVEVHDAEDLLAAALLALRLTPQPIL